MQWNIGFAKGDIAEIIRKKNNSLSFKWLPLNNANKSIADPFIFRTEGGMINLLYEDFSMVNLENYGKIGLSILDENFEIVCNKEILDSASHLSYPFVFKQDNKTYIIPESSQKSEVCCYEYDAANKCLINKRSIIDHLPLLDSTIFKWNDKYWLFATLADGKFDHSKLYIYYSDSFFGPYSAHLNNPVKSGLNGTRPAGNLIMVDGEIYRPAQNCERHYGESITLNRITNLSEREFEEEMHCQILPDKNSEFKDGIHTINFVDDIIVVDGIRMRFNPIKKIILFIKRVIKLG